MFPKIRADKERLSPEELWEAWEKEAVRAAMEAGTVVSMYKACRPAAGGGDRGRLTHTHQGD